MGIASQPSKLSLPQHNPGVVTVLDYLIKKFPAIKPLVWQQRVYYSREVESEAIIPFTEAVLFQDEHILVAVPPVNIIVPFFWSLLLSAWCCDSPVSMVQARPPFATEPYFLYRAKK